MSNGRRTPKKRHTDTDKPTRDTQGRWLPGHCPNPKGRPRKADKIDVDRADLGRFMNTEVEMKVGGELVSMTREEALLHKMYEGAMGGKVSNQKFFYEQFQQRKKDIAELRAEYDRLVAEWFIENPTIKTNGIESIPFQVKAQIVGLENLLGRVFPEDYPGTFTTLLGYGEE